jgi:FkbM family methyltransferase
MTVLRLQIGRFELELPADHALGQYRQHYRLYDWALGEIARFVARKYPDATAVDMGANVGDSAAAICRHQDMPVLCIEGDPVFSAYLRRNLARLPPGIEPVETLVGKASGSVAPQALRRAHGTASLEAAASAPAAGALSVQTLAGILDAHPAFSAPRLLKSDTDGADFEILLSSTELLKICHPVLFFEYDPTLRQDGLKASLEAIAALEACGYRSFLIYDNFGNFLEAVHGNPLARFAELNRYLMSHAMFGRQIYYLDVCALSEADRDLAQALVDFHAAFIDERIAEPGPAR